MVPVLVAALICDVAVQDPVTGKKNLIGIFDRLWAGKFPTARPISLYIKITDAEGKYVLEVKYVKLDTDEVLGAATAEFKVEDRLQSFDFVIQLPPAPIPEAGRYEFQIWANETFIGSAFLDAVAR